MDKLNFSDLKREIEKCKPSVEKRVVAERTSERRTRMRERDLDEANILDNICIDKWKRAEAQGKIKYYSDRKWYYDYD